MSSTGGKKSNYTNGFFLEKNGYHPGVKYKKEKYPGGIKSCLGCGEIKKIDCFYLIGDIRQSRCTICANEERKENYAKQKLREGKVVKQREKIEPIIGSRYCTKCKKIKIETDFYEKVRYWCKNCHSESCKRRRDIKKDIMNVQNFMNDWVKKP